MLDANVVLGLQNAPSVSRAFGLREAAPDTG
jgi:hypothetical protein